jgi:glutamate/tyrosine decarboxylase-like PLP-dependent enzyme
MSRIENGLILNQLVGSAPNFPYGSIDDIPAIAEV